MPQLGSGTPLDAVLVTTHTTQAVISRQLSPLSCCQRMPLSSTAGLLPSIASLAQHLIDSEP
jgi:hypothetical protein